MSRKENSSFWPSYVDVMTTLFAIMLVLFAVSFGRFKSEQSKLELLVEDYNNIIDVYTTVGKIDSTEYFGYDEEYLKHLLTIDVEYQTKEYQINKLKLDLTNPAAAEKKRNDIILAGKTIMKTIKELENTRYSDGNIKFLIVIEGQSSKLTFNGGDWINNYTLSYLRAKYLNEFWKENGIHLDSLPRCELIIAGSGEEGVPRVIPNEEELYRLYPNEKDYLENWLKEEEKNQRFLVNIVPVIGNIEIIQEKIKEIREK